MCFVLCICRYCRMSGSMIQQPHMGDALTSGRSKAATPITEKNPPGKDSMIKQRSLTLPLMRPPKREWHDQGTCFHTSAQATLCRQKRKTQANKQSKANTSLAALRGF